MNFFHKSLCFFPSILALNLAMLSCSLSNKHIVKDDTLIFLPDSLPAGKVGEQYEVIITIQKAKTSVSAFHLTEGVLPSGLTIYECGGNQQPCEDEFKIVGVPDTTGIFEFKVSVSCFGTNVNGETGNKTYQIKIKSILD